jgi:hypothetical protein
MRSPGKVQQGGCQEVPGRGAPGQGARPGTVLGNGPHSAHSGNQNGTYGSHTNIRPEHRRNQWKGP